MRLVASPHLSQEDIEAIQLGLRQREDVIADALARELVPEFSGFIGNRIACLSWLLAHNILEIKIAVVRDLQNYGIYHEKLGIFTDSEDNRVAFGGSANESARAYHNNFECIDVFCSWRTGDSDRIIEKLQNFEELWQNHTPDLDVLEFPEAARRKLLEKCPHDPPDFVQEIEASIQVANPTERYHTIPGVPIAPNSLVLRDYQQQAIANWFVNKGHGTLKMATGSGKTITALAIAAELYKKCQAQNKPLKALLIICPYRHLVTQWAEESRKFNLDPVLAFDRAHTWQRELQTQLLAVLGERQPFVSIITTNATLRQESLQSQLAFLPQLAMIIGDEAHN
ncbi:DEAD/DEAH box helicase family protein [Nodosilinea sp. LEGE 07088]|uniref:DEAD/DEAH box helicase family protein n=1 Tax=Nodosilinea sp. LEGE 07088 TaxID=2777968 RepID=UPI0034D96F8E